MGEELVLRPEDIGLAVKRLRIARGWSLQQLGDKVGFTSSHVFRLEKNERTWNIETVDRIFKALGVSMCLVVGAGEKSVWKTENGG
jgi:transcriptional regulator with XRE-family HTH domain